MADGSGNALLQRLTALGGAPGGTPSLLQLTALAGVNGGAPASRVLTASGQTPTAGYATLRQLTASGKANPEPSDGLARLEVPTATGVGFFPNTGIAAVSLQALTAAGFYQVGGAPSLSALTASGTGLAGTAASGAARLAPLVASGAASGPNLASGNGILLKLTASGRGAPGTIAAGAAALYRLQASASGVGGTAGKGSASLVQLAAAATALQLTGATGAIRTPFVLAYGTGEAALAATTDAWAMNTRTNAVTRYPGYPVNSLARYNGTYLGAGSGGLYLLEGGQNLDADGTKIAWVVRTGQMDDKSSFLKRLVEVLLGLRYDGTVRVRIYKDDVTFYDYPLTNQRSGAIQQVRVKPGKGMRSRYFQVELSGQGASFQLDSLQATMPQTSRRIG